MCLLGMWTRALGGVLQLWAIAVQAPGPGPCKAGQQSRVRKPETSCRGPGIRLRLQHLPTVSLPGVGGTEHSGHQGKDSMLAPAAPAPT